MYPVRLAPGPLFVTRRWNWGRGRTIVYGGERRRWSARPLADVAWRLRLSSWRLAYAGTILGHRVAGAAKSTQPYWLFAPERLAIEGTLEIGGAPAGRMRIARDGHKAPFTLRLDGAGGRECVTMTCDLRRVTVAVDGQDIIRAPSCHTPFLDDVRSLLGFARYTWGDVLETGRGPVAPAAVVGCLFAVALANGRPGDDLLAPQRMD